jgi:hypothetical protein
MSRFEPLNFLEEERGCGEAQPQPIAFAKSDNPLFPHDEGWF